MTSNLSKSLVPRICESLEISTFHALFFRKTTTCPALPFSPSFAYETAQSTPEVPGTRQQSNIHLGDTFNEDGREIVTHEPIGVHADRSLLGSLRFELAELVLLSEKQHRSRQRGGSMCRCLWQVFGVRVEAVFRKRLNV